MPSDFKRGALAPHRRVCARPGWQRLHNAAHATRSSSNAIDTRQLRPRASRVVVQPPASYAHVTTTRLQQPGEA